MFRYEYLCLFLAFFFFIADDKFSGVRIALGKGFLDRYCLIECKQFFSIYFHVFNTIEQDRFHTHAFNAIAILVKGGYEEEVIGSDGLVRKVKIGPGIRYIPRSYNHRLLKSEPNTLSLLFAGPWYSTWTEENDQYIRTLTWGRQEVGREMKALPTLSVEDTPALTNEEVKFVHSMEFPYCSCGMFIPTEGRLCAHCKDGNRHLALKEHSEQLMMRRNVTSIRKKHTTPDTWIKIRFSDIEYRNTYGEA